jgi:ssDNA-specific exonuclease RecJ
MYLSKNIPSRYRSALAKFRCGVAPLWIETGRYENKNVNERVCFICHDQIEDEKHVLLDCPLYVDLRERLFNEAKRSNVHFIILSDDDKFIYLFKSAECYDMVLFTELKCFRHDLKF